METTKLLHYQNFIDGKWAEPKNGNYITKYSPSTGEIIGYLPQSTEEDVDYAINSALNGLSEWRSKEHSERGRILYKVSQKITENSELLAHLETLDTGRPLFFSKKIVENSARYFEYMAGIADKIYSEVIPTPQKYLTYTLREPYGIIGHILPWNAPIQTCSRDISSALAAGNVVVTKISENAGFSVLELARLFIEAGAPPGVFNVISGYGEEVGLPLIRNENVKKVTFTGSVTTGQIILQEAAKRIIPATVELGGKSPNIIFDDANLDDAVTVALQSFLLNSGQICSATTRILIQENIKEEFEKKLLEKISSIQVGDGSIEGNFVGPLISNSQLSRVLDYVELGKSEGARILYGGNKFEGEGCNNGYFMQPTVFTDTKNEMKIAREEIFGPVAVIIPFKSEEEAIKIANDSEYGLACMIWTGNLGRAHRVAKKIEVGEVFINDFMPIAVEAPFGGYKKSGIGREKGLESLKSYTQLKTITVKTM